jgi:hypothetical protein
VPGARRGRGARGFTEGGPLHRARPGVELVRKLDRAAGSARRCEQASDDEAFGLLGRWDAAEAWCASAKLGVIRELIRRHPEPGEGPATPGGLPKAWQEGLIQEVAMELGVSVRAADSLIDLAWALGTRLKLTAAALDTGVISLSKARIIAEATAVLDDKRAAAAEALIAHRLAGKTHGQIAAMIGRAVVEVDPEGARKRREQAEKEEARVAFWREHAGTATLAAFGLPPDEALAANQNIQDRALEYKAAGVSGTMDQLRVRAFLDAINGTDSRLLASTTSKDGSGDGSEPTAEESDGDQARSGDAAGAGRPDADAASAGQPDDVGPAGGAGVAGGAALAANIMLTIPLATLGGYAEKPGDAAGFGAIDPGLARQLAAAAARSPRSAWCVTVTDEHGHAIGHGCAKRAGKTRRPGRSGAAGNRGSPGRASPAGGGGNSEGTFLSFIPAGQPGPPGGYGTWRLTIAGREFTVKLVTIPVTSCDHQLESNGYQPSDQLRHLVEVRDGECTQPTCRRSARRCDFEHAVPWHKGGKTCACNGGCRCRRDHKIKQSPGWTVTQPRPGYHRWTTPAGRSYVTEPMRYPI